MAFKAFEEVHGDQTLVLPVRGKHYTVFPPAADVGLALSMRLAAGIVLQAGVPLTDEAIEEADEATRITDDELPDFARQCLGPVYDEMIADKVPVDALEFAVQAAFLAWTLDREAAEIFWNTGGKAPGPALTYPALPPTATPTRTAAATTTKSRALATGTSTRKGKPGQRRKAAPSTGASPTTTT